jgi:REP element-mobilizing transposase RayT
MEHEPLVQGNYYHIFNRGNNRCNLFEQPAEYEHFLWLYDKYISPVADTLAWVLMRNHFHLLVYIKTDVVYKYSIETLNRISPDKIWYEEHKWETTDLSASAGPDNVTKSINADRSRDAVRSGGSVVGFDFDLSACAAPDNVKILKDNVNLELVNADRSRDAVRFKQPVPHKHFSHLFNAYSRYLQIRTGRTGNLFERPFKRKLIDNEEYLKTAVLYIHNNPVHHGFCSHPLEYPWTSYLTSISEIPTKLKRDEVIKLFSNKENFEQQHNQKIDVGQFEKWLEIAPSDLHDLDLSEQVDADRSIDAVRSGETDVVGFDLSAYAAPARLRHSGGPDNVKKKRMDDKVKMEVVDEKVDADRSGDAVRSEELTTVGFDLSACAAPDNVENGIIDADRACPDISGSRDAVPSENDEQIKIS